MICLLHQEVSKPFWREDRAELSGCLCVYEKRWRRDDPKPSSLRRCYRFESLFWHRRERKPDSVICQGRVASNPVTLTHHKFRGDTQDEARSRPLWPEKNHKKIIDQVIEDGTIFSLIWILCSLAFARPRTKVKIKAKKSTARHTVASRKW